MRQINHVSILRLNGTKIMTSSIYNHYIIPQMKLSTNFIIFLFIVNIVIPVHAQKHDKSWRNITQQEEGSWFASQEAKNIAENVLLYQRDLGGWPKNIQMHEPLSDEKKQELLALKSDLKNITTDNGATIQEMRFLSKMYRQIPDEKYKNAFLKGIDYILKAQYVNGGWPQFYPLRKGYYTHITFNDDSMVNILNLLKAVKDNTGEYAIKPSQETLTKIEVAFNKAIDRILKMQYKQNGVLTSWCAQHDENTLAPAKARSYELPSLSGKESAQIVLLLMSIENPSKAIIKAVNSAVNWFEKVKITGLREEKFFNEALQLEDKRVVPDETASPLWARFMELEDNTPFFCDRDGIKKASMAEIGHERRNGYAWYSKDPQKVLKAYQEWKTKFNVSTPNTKTVKKEEIAYNMVVAKDGSGDYTTIQEAINASKAFPSQRVIITVKNGVYNEKVHVYSWNTHLSLIGESKENTIISYSDYFKKINLGRNSTFHTSTVLVEGDDFVAKNLTIQNISGAVGQAIALSVNANRAVVDNCIIKGFQDTVYTAGEGFKQYFKNCYISGSTDFIFGAATVVFEACTIHSRTNSYITAASTPKNQNYGYVFKNCKLTADKHVDKVYLGRPWRLYAKTVFINCEMGRHILPEGWHNWSKKQAETTTFYGEYGSTGDGAKLAVRVAWAHLLKKSKVKKYTLEHIFESKTDNPSWYTNY